MASTLKSSLVLENFSASPFLPHYDGVGALVRALSHPRSSTTYFWTYLKCIFEIYFHIHSTVCKTTVDICMSYFICNKSYMYIFESCVL